MLPFARVSIIGLGLIGSSINCSMTWITRLSLGWRTPMRVGIDRRWVSWSVRIEE